jgi:hypothetical protein
VSVSEAPPLAARASPSAARNRDPVFQVLKPHLPAEGLILEIAAGSGEHAVHFAAAAPQLSWRPSDLGRDALASIAAWRAHAALPNLLAPLQLDAERPDLWPIEHADGIVNINMAHISPWSATVGLMAGAGRVLAAGGVLFLYGPYVEQGVPTAPSNLEFDLQLRSRDPAWGLRNVEDVTALAREQGLRLIERVAMPANNLSLIFHRD